MSVKNVGGKAVGCCANFWGGFYDFFLHPSILYVAIGFVLGGAFKDLVSSFVAAFITPLIGMIAGEDFAQMKFTVLGSSFFYGQFINALITFVVIAFALYVFIIYPLVTLTKRYRCRSCPECGMHDLPYSATRCKYCCSSVIPLEPKSEDELVTGPSPTATTTVPA